MPSCSTRTGRPVLSNTRSTDLRGVHLHPDIGLALESVGLAVHAQNAAALWHGFPIGNLQLAIALRHVQRKRRRCQRRPHGIAAHLDLAAVDDHPYFNVSYG